MEKVRHEIDPRGRATSHALRVVGLGMLVTGAVLTAIGLERYWRASGTEPDYRRFS